MLGIAGLTFGLMGFSCIALGSWRARSLEKSGSFVCFCIEFSPSLLVHSLQHQHFV